MPKIVVYVRAEDSRTIEAVTGKPIEEWTRAQLADAIARFKEAEIERFGPQLPPDLSDSLE
jgi:hypothetical protein